MKSYYSITWISFTRWFIEATCAQFIMFVFYTGFNEWLIEEEPGAHMVGVIMLKVCLFFVTRYAETEPDASFNKLRVVLLFSLRNSSDYHIFHSNSFTQ